MDRRLIQILLIIGGVEQNPGPGHIVSVDRDEYRPSGVVANNACRDALSNAEHNEITRTSNNTERTMYELATRISRNSRLNNIDYKAGLNHIDVYSCGPERISVSPYNTNYNEFDRHGTEPVPTTQMPIQNILLTNVNVQLL